MFKIYKDQVHDLIDARFTELSIRIDSWLLSNCVAWRSVTPIEREARLKRLVVAAQSAGMRVEVDYAVFCRLFAENGDLPETLLKAPDINQVLNTDWQPSAKLTRLELLLSNELKEEI